MNHRQKYLSACLLGIATLLGSASPAFAATAPNLGSAASFAVLAGSAVTCTNSAVNGDVGVSPGTAVTQTLCTINGTIHANDSVAIQANSDFFSAYDALAAMSCTPLTLANTGTTVGRNLSTLAGVTLTPGVYCVDAVAKTGVLTLNGDGIWIFKVAADPATIPPTGALTGTNFSVVLNNGATACNVYWWVAEAATMTTSDFKGTILAGAAITITGGTFTGNAYAKAAVTMTGVSVTGCGGSASFIPPRLRCNQGVGNGPEGCDPGNSNQSNRYPNADNPFLRSNDESSLFTPGAPGRKGGNK